jgi:hypothetical protein
MNRKKTKFTQSGSWSDYGEDQTGQLPVAVTPLGGERVGIDSDDVGCMQWNSNVAYSGGWVVMARDAAGQPLISAKMADGGDNPTRRSGRYWATAEVLAPEGSEFHFAEAADDE